MMSDIKQTMAHFATRNSEIDESVIVLTPFQKKWHDANPGYLPVNAKVIVNKPLPLTGGHDGNSQ